MMKRWVITCLPCLVLLIGCAASHGQPDGEPPATQPADTSATQPADQPAARPGEDASVDTWLTWLEARGQAITTLQAKLRWDSEQILQGDHQIRFGTLIYEAGPPARFAIPLHALVVDGERQDHTRSYVFDGQWLVEKLDDRKQFFKRQLVPPDADPAQVDPLAQGDGPFALPVRLRKADIESRYRVKLVDPAEDDPENSVHLNLILLETPDADAADDGDVLDIWLDRDSAVPMRVRKTEQEVTVQTYSLFDPVINEALDEKTFDTSEPTDRGWHVEVIRWQNPTAE